MWYMVIIKILKNYKNIAEGENRVSTAPKSATRLPYVPVGCGLPGEQAAGRSLRLVRRPPLTDLAWDTG